MVVFRHRNKRKEVIEMMKITKKWSVRLVRGHGLGWFDSLLDAQAFANGLAVDTIINEVTLHEMVKA
jgi:predicted amidohydrolase